MAAAALKNRRLLQVTLDACVQNYSTTLQFETMEPGSPGGGREPKLNFVERGKLARFTAVRAIIDAFDHFVSVGYRAGARCCRFR